MGLRFQHPAPVPLGEQGNVGWREEENIAKQVRGPGLMRLFWRASPNRGWPALGNAWAAAAGSNLRCRFDQQQSSLTGNQQV